MSLRRAAGPFLRPGKTARRFGAYGGVKKLSTDSRTWKWKVELDFEKLFFGWGYSTIPLALITGGIAWSKNRSAQNWFVGTLFFGRFAPLYLVTFPDLHDKGSLTKGIKAIDFKVQVQTYPEDKSGDKSNES